MLSTHLTNWRRWLWRCILASGLFYLVAGTEGGLVFYSLTGAALHPIANDTVKRAWCDTGNWMADTFQPLVSDEKMIAHLQAHQAEMEKLAWMVINKQYTRAKGGLTPEFELESKRLEMHSVGVRGSWPLEPYSVEAARVEKACRAIQDADRTHKTGGVCRPTLNAVSMQPAFGRNRVANFCSQHTGVAFKQYTYYPGVAPIVVGNRIQYEVDAEGQPVFGNSIVVPNTDHVRQDICQYRRIAPHWFISVC